MVRKVDSTGTLPTNEVGVATVEYIILVCLVSLVGAVAVAGLGVPLLESYRYSQLIIGLPVP